LIASPKSEVTEAAPRIGFSAKCKYAGILISRRVMPFEHGNRLAARTNYSTATLILQFLPQSIQLVASFILKAL
jgi:hypothetical protein